MFANFENHLNMEFRAFCVLILSCVAIGFAGCSDDQDVRDQALGDVGIDALEGPDADGSTGEDPDAADVTDDAADSSDSGRDVGGSDVVEQDAGDPDGGIGDAGDETAADVESDTTTGAQDARVDTEEADATTDVGAGADVAEDAEGVDTGGEDTGSEDTGGEGTPDAEPDVTQPTACTDGDGVCPAGCYVTTDDDCTLDCTDASSWPPSWVAFEDEVLRLSNLERAAGASCGGENYPAVSALVADPQLREAARCHSLDMAVNDFFDHSGSDNSRAGDRITRAGYQYWYWAENISAGRDTPAEVVAAWMNSTGHCKNIMSSHAEELGVGYVFDSPDAFHGYERYWTQVFGQPR